MKQSLYVNLTNEQSLAVVSVRIYLQEGKDFLEAIDHTGTVIKVPATEVAGVVYNQEPEETR